MTEGLRCHRSASLGLASRSKILDLLIRYAKRGQWAIVIGAAMHLHDMDNAARKAARRKKR